MVTNGLEMNCGSGLGALVALVVSRPGVMAPPLRVSESVEFTARLRQLSV